ncbi:MAG: energy transducer TonB [Terracidiphilus sp.]
MLRAGCLLALVTIAAGTAGAQQEIAPSTTDGPIAIKPAAPIPDKDGVYSVGPGIEPPRLVRAEPALYPADAPPLDRPMSCIFSTVIGVDGTPSKIQLARGCLQERFVAPSIEAIQHSQFEPGTWNGKPVPVLIRVLIGYRYPGTPGTLRIALLYREGFGHGPPRERAFDKPPIVTHMVNAEYSEDARRRKIQGVVMVSALVSTEGVPTDLRVERSLGYGLDESALGCVSQYEFKPATKDGVPVAARITVEVNFRLY